MLFCYNLLISPKAMYFPISYKLAVKILFLVFVIICIGILLVPRLWSGDAYDNLVGGCLISHGAMIYRDFFAHHAPLPYYLVGLVDGLTGTCSYLLPQLFFFGFFVASVLLLLKYTKSFFSAFFLLFTYASLGIVYGTIFVEAESWLASVSILIFLLLFFSKQMNKFVFWTIFIIVQLSIQAAMPLYMLIALLLFLYFAMKDKAKIIYYFLASFLPFLVLLVYLNFANYYHYVFLFNNTYYAAYVGSFLQQYVTFIPATISSLIHIAATPKDWKLIDTYAFLFSTIVMVVWISLQIAYRKKLYQHTPFLFIVNLLVFINLSFHIGGGHMVPLVFFALTEILFIFSTIPLPKRYYLLLIVLFLLLARLLRFEQVLFTTQDYSEPYYTKFILAHSKPSDNVLFLNKNALYILTNRMPGSYYYFLLPWVADEKGAEQRVLSDIEREKVKIIIIYNTNLIFSKHSPVQYISYIERNLKRDKHYKEVSKIKGVQIFVREG